MRIILIGYGIVGQSFTKLLLSKLVDLYNIYGMKPRIVACVDNKGSAIDTSGLDIQRLLEIKKNKGTVGEYHRNKTSRLEPLQIIENIDAEIVMELTPTNLKDGEPGLSHIISAMKYSKNVITVNKGPLSVAFSSLIELANYNGIMFKFSGTVGGGTPILEFAKRCLKGDRIVSFKGILNGTTNFILSKMEEGLTFKNALKDAQIKGYAETIPSLDIDGFDAAAKLVIMANWLMGMKVALEDVNRTGITKVTTQEVSKALKKGNAIKLIASCENKKLVVKPMDVSKLDPLCVNGTLNSVTFSLEYAGNQTIIGRGAGGIETASAVLRDMIEIRENIINEKNLS
ncbi:MAG TPA: homoserine dehydrogenase [Nitrososphaeraceae archaeon]|nr:homoserine dehydrogenase [Nitrososphaeraceae archaeon]